MSDLSRPPSRGDTLATLRKLVRALERPHDEARRAVLPTGMAAIDAALPDGGLARAALHEVTAPFADPAAGAFVLALLAKLCGKGGHFVWCRRRQTASLVGIPYGPGLLRFGVRPEQLTLVEVEKSSDVLWAMEESLKAAGLAAVYGEDITLDLTASRRLQLAAEASGVTAFVHLPPGQHAPPSAALSRWRVRSTASPPGRPLSSRWDVTLERCRGGSSKHWTVDWDEEALAFHLAAPLSDPSARDSGTY